MPPRKRKAPAPKPAPNPEPAETEPYVKPVWMVPTDNGYVPEDSLHQKRK